ncbi:retropepsin-like aspartic protease family protein [Undibacterium sp.]|jgi:aspartyl protease family protein|uniref:retropepsin-like aspartic protease family protein n=1 Tax=Undibacterium sp. TaxID=1914977 RepID=UPI002B5F8F73|nr:TIGR02281 family clan AA aspartic protease [Undibacterium sp.]HTD02393.1 TIGR02281 family clan AA aspartic protease [Undibacterium sp.]
MIKTVVALACLSACICASQAASIGVVGLYPGKAVLVIEDSAPKTYSVGSSLGDGARLVAVDDNTATIEANGKRQVLTMGQYVHHSTASANNSSVTLQADTQGHFVARGQINGGSVSMLVDTGASMIAMPASEATRLGIEYRKGQIGRAGTANGVVTVYKVKLDTVKIGDIEVHQVDAMVQESGLPFILLGMSFLNRMEMQRDGQQMVLTKRF